MQASLWLKRVLWMAVFWAGGVLIMLAMAGGLRLWLVG